MPHITDPLAQEPEAPILGVLFVDIVDSTRLYHTLGDAGARKEILACLARLGQVVTGFGGWIVDSIGDELMCTFDSSERTLECAVALQQTTVELARADAGTTISVRIGLEVGPVLRESSRVFGQTVYTAKRMVSLAKTRQIVTTAGTASRLGTSCAVATRFLDRIVLKGDQLPTTIFEVIWDPESATEPRLTPGEGATQAGVCLRYAGRELVVDEGRPEITLGRGESCDLVVSGDDVSWLHARIQCRKGRPTLTDLSTNGTFLHPDGAPMGTCVHRDTVPLVGGGHLGLGRPLVPGDEAAVAFACRIIP